MKELNRRVLISQRSEITEHHIYSKLARVMSRKADRDVLQHLAYDELRHYGIWKEITGRDVSPNVVKIWFYYVISRLLGLNFGLRLMERGEAVAQGVYDELKHDYPQLDTVLQDEQRHEKDLLDLIDERFLKYTGSVVLGLSDAIVELTGALAGLTLALQNAHLIAVVGLITGFAASLSMGASEYLSTKEDKRESPFRAGIATGFAYVFSVVILITPFFLFADVFVSLGVAFVSAIFIIFLFTFYTAVARGLSFKKRFFEMVLIAVGVACINFVIGYLIRQYLGVDA